MIYEKYQVNISPNHLSYEFVSIGPKGNITKLVEYTEISHGIYNLGFGDKNSATGFIDDKIVINNGDGEKVLATVASTLYSFTNLYPQAVISATGSTPSRTRLYQISISQNLALIKQDFEVYGLKLSDEWEAFTKNCTYKAFLAYKKNNKFD